MLYHAGAQASITQLMRKTMKVFEDLERRGLVKQVTDATRVSMLLESESPITFYIGFDPTADSLHVGHLLQLVTAKRLLDAGRTMTHSHIDLGTLRDVAAAVLDELPRLIGEVEAVDVFITRP